MNKFESIKRYIDKANTIYLVAHKHPDGDAIGSVGAMYHFLRDMGKNVYMLLPEVTEKFNFLPDIDKRVDLVELEKYDLLICLDTSNLERLEISLADIAKAKKKIVIDHHRNNMIDADIKLVDEQAPANCEIVYDIIKYMNHNISKNIAEYIYMGIMTDTGSFNYERTSRKTHNIVGEMIELGADYVRTCNILNHTNSEAKMKLISKVIDNMESILDGKVRFGYTDKQTLDELKVNDDDTSNIINYLKSIEGTTVAIYIRALDDVNYKVSIRASEPIDASEISLIFGGGGHKRAAGFSTDNVEETKDKLIKILERLLKK